VICGGELESPHFHISTEGWRTAIDIEVTMQYIQGEQENVGRRILRLPLKEEYLVDEYMMPEEYLGEEISLSSELDYSSVSRNPQIEEMSVEIQIEAATETETEMELGLGAEESIGFEAHFYNVIRKATIIAMCGISALVLITFVCTDMKGKRGERKPLLE